MKIEFEHQWGGEDTWYLKLERWANKQPMPINILAQGMIKWLKKIWIDAKIQNTMREVDFQSNKIVQEWEDNDRTNRRHVLETGVFGDEGWSIQITNKSFEGRTSFTVPKLAPRSNERRLEKNEGD